MRTAGIRGKVLHQEPLKNHTTIGLGGPTPLMLVPEDLEDLKEALLFVLQEGKQYRLLGRGSNLLVRDQGIKEAVIKIGPGLNKCTVQGAKILAEAGASLPYLSKLAARKGLSGLEFALGIPASLGGALVNNAGVKEEEVGGVVEAVQLLDEQGSFRWSEREELTFGYRSSSLKSSGLIVTAASLRLQAAEREEIRRKMKKLQEKRIKTQPLQPSFGSVFKNPPGDYAGRLIEAVGLKGFTLGGAAVSERHANFIVNRGQATTEQVLKLMELIRERVAEKEDVILEAEVEIW